MSNFKKLIENILVEYDRDDLSDNFWQAAKNYKQTQFEKEKLYSKTINPVNAKDLVYIKAVFTNKTTNNISVFYISNNQPKSPYVKEKSQATQFSVTEGENFINKHPKQIVKDKNNNEFERHFELEKI